MSKISKRKMKNKNKKEKEDLSKKVFSLDSQYVAVERFGKGTYGTVY